MSQAAQPSKHTDYLWVENKVKELFAQRRAEMAQTNHAVNLPKQLEMLERPFILAFSRAVFGRPAVIEVGDGNIAISPATIDMPATARALNARMKQEFTKIREGIIASAENKQYAAYMLNQVYGDQFMPAIAEEFSRQVVANISAPAR